MRRREPELSPEAANLAGPYGLDEHIAGREAWFIIQRQLQAFTAWYSEEVNIERPLAMLSATTIEGARRAILYYCGFCVRFHNQHGTMDCFLKGPLLQAYSTFLKNRPCTDNTIVKVLGQVSPCQS
jgi:hypothetical protein